MAHSEHKWWKDKENVGTRKKAEIKFLFSRADRKKLSVMSEEQKLSALRNLDEIEGVFNGHLKETREILTQ